MTLVPYGYLRVLEMEGRQPPNDGGWGLTLKRLAFFEGLPPDGHPFEYVEVPDGGPLPPAPAVSRDLLRRNRCEFYRRIRSSTELEFLFARSRDPAVAFGIELFRSWTTTVDGSIPDPMPGESPLGPTHVVRVIGYAPERKRFQFINSWGESWGNHGFGDVSCYYFDKFCFSCWQSIAMVQWDYAHRLGKKEKYTECYRRTSDEFGRDLYSVVIVDQVGDDPVAWALIQRRDGALEIEDLFVRPEYREKGFGSSLAKRVVELAKAIALPIRIWVDFADSKQESPETYSALTAMAKRLGVQFHQSNLIQAAYFATNEKAGSQSPIEPFHHPQRPKSTLRDLLAASMMVPPLLNIASTEAASLGLDNGRQPETISVRSGQGDVEKAERIARYSSPEFTKQLLAHMREAVRIALQEVPEQPEK